MWGVFFMWVVECWLLGWFWLSFCFVGLCRISLLEEFCRIMLFLDVFLVLFWLWVWIFLCIFLSCVFDWYWEGKRFFICIMCCKELYFIDILLFIIILYSIVLFLFEFIVFYRLWNIWFKLFMKLSYLDWEG